jgi:hypothetical protein
LVTRSIRLVEDEGASLETELPIEYQRDELADDIAYLARFPQKAITAEISMLERRWRDIAREGRRRGKRRLDESRELPRSTALEAN